MDFTLSADEIAVVEAAEQVSRDVLAVHASAADAGAFPAASIAALGEAGLCGIKIAKQYGGLGSTQLAFCSAIRAMAGACASTAVTVAVTNMVADMIEKFGSDAQKQAHLRNLARGVYSAGSFALSEPSAGSDAAALRTRAEKIEGGYRLNGSKLWITSGDRAQVVLVLAKTDPTLGAKGITAFLVQADNPGLSIGRHEEKLGLRGSSTVSLNFTDCIVAESDLLGRLGGGFEVAMTALDGGRCGIGAQALGMGFATLAATSQHLQKHQAANREQGTEQMAQFRLADMTLRLEAAWLLVQRAAWLRDQGKKMTREAAMAKVNATEAANFACQTAMQILGPTGLDARHPVSRALRDVRVSRIYEGTSEIQRLVIARSLTASL